MGNPDKYIRKAVIDSIKASLGHNNVWHRYVPKDIIPAPTDYVLITTQTKNETQQAKLKQNSLQQNKYFEWLCNINIDPIHVNENHFTSMVSVDNMEELILNGLQSGIIVEGYSVKNIEYINTIDLSVHTVEKSIDRRSIIIQYWLSLK